MNMNKKVILPLVILLVILAGGVVYLFLSLNAEKMNSRQMQELAELDKKEMENEYREFSNQYSEMMTKINNDSIIAQLTQEQLRTQQLLKELQQTKSHDAAEITRLKKELAQVRAVLREYVIQIDSLNRQNERLTAENARINSALEESARQNEALTSEKASLTEKVASDSPKRYEDSLCPYHHSYRLCPLRRYYPLREQAHTVFYQEIDRVQWRGYSCDNVLEHP